MYYKYILSSTVGLFLGIILSLSINFSSEIFIVSLFLSMGNFFIFKFYKKSYTIYTSFLSKIFFSVFLFTSIGILFGQYSISQNINKFEKFKTYIQDKTSFTGIVNDISVTQSSQKFILNIKDENLDTYKVQIVTSLYPKYRAGESVSVEGKMSFGEIVLPDIKNYSNSFSVLDRNKNLNIQAEMIFPKILIIENNSPKNIFYVLENFKTDLVDILEKNTSIKTASLSAGTTLGDTSLFSKEDLLNFKKSGLSHIIVLSGFNITILIFLSIYILNFLNFKLKTRIFISICIIFIFVSFVGAGPSILRAAIMGMIAIIANSFGRQYVAKQSLFISAFVMMILSPFIALYDISFHLSFLATFGILYLLPILEEYDFIKNIDEKILSIKNRFLKNFLKDIFEILKVSIAVQIFVTPYIMFAFGKISLFGVVSNILVLPVVSIIMIFTFLILFSNIFSSTLSIIFGYVSNIFCSYVFYISDFVSSISFNQYTSNISSLNMFIIYFFLILFLIFEEKRKFIKRYISEG